jgi:hypothetical protein
VVFLEVAGVASTDAAAFGKWIGFPGDPIRRGDPYAKWIFTDKTYPYEHKPLPMKPYKGGK